MIHHRETTLVWTENSNKINLFRISQNTRRRVRQELVVEQEIEDRRQGKGLENVGDKKLN